jgi:hypothetical protein
MLAQQLRVMVDHPVRRVSAPVSNDLTAHPGVHELRNPFSSKSMHSDAGLDQLQLFQDWVKLVLPHVG